MYKLNIKRVGGYKMDECIWYFNGGDIKQTTHEEEIRELLIVERKLTFYIGFDPTADSLHVGHHFIAMMFMAHMQKSRS